MSNSVSEIELFETLSEQIGKEKAKIFVEYMENKVDKRLQEKTSVFLTKQDKVDIIKWMFAFWIGTIGILSGIMFALLSAYLK
ncbi:MAG: hypothetical protein KGP35_07835 [Bacteroidetes bacterium]|nr:hypothetical protein [Bacteroidota bacterium]